MRAPMSQRYHVLPVVSLTRIVTYSSTDDDSGQIPAVEQFADKGTLSIMPTPQKRASCIEKVKKLVSTEESDKITDKICQVRE